MVELESHNWQSLSRATCANNKCNNYRSRLLTRWLNFVELAVFRTAGIFMSNVVAVTCLEYGFELVCSRRVFTQLQQ